MKAQMGLPDMKLPIQYALTYPKRLQTDFPRFDFLNYPSLTFEAPDRKTFRNLDLAFDAMRQGGNMPCILNAANEIAVQLFLEDKISFLGIAELNEKCMMNMPFISTPTLDDYINTDAETRKMALNFGKK
jgi:1-deoxy-D-xylulose-5-phosphate reductoisomerase